MVTKLMLHIELLSPRPLSRRSSLALSTLRQHGFTTGELAQALILLGNRQDSRGTQLHVSENVELGHAH